MAFVTVTALHLAVAAAGTGWLVIGILVYAPTAVRRALT